jgi:hypothetical protein
MPKQWITKYGVAQVRRPGSALFPPTLVLNACQITLERDGLHLTSQREEGTPPLVFSRAEVASLVGWLKGESAWFGNDLDPAYEVEDEPQECGYCLRNLTHTKEVHDAQVTAAREQRTQLLTGQRFASVEQGRKKGHE